MKGKVSYMNKEIIRFENGNIQLDVTVTPEEDTVWLSVSQMSLLFDRDFKTIHKHINNIFYEGELLKTTNIKIISVKGSKKGLTLYSLDTIISVGYRVKSTNGIIFRKWATSVLKDYMLKGVAVNQKRLDVLNKTIEIQSKMLASSLDMDVKEVTDIVHAYSSALALLDDYDHGSVNKPKGNDCVYQLTYKECRNIIDSMNIPSNVFGIEKQPGQLEGILATINQHLFGKEVYPSIEEKAANLLYFIIKDHPFVDGCKRIGASLFLEFLNRNHHLIRNHRQIVSNSALVAITLMVAQSNPEEKEVMVRLVMNFLVSG